MKILLTHATGFLGSYLLEELSRQDLKIKAATRPEAPIQEMESDFLIDGLDLESIRLNLLNFQEVLEAVHDVQIIFHLDQIEAWEEPKKKHRQAKEKEIWHNLAKACGRFPVEKIIVTGQADSLELNEQGYLIAERSSKKIPRKRRPLANPLEEEWEKSLKAGLPLLRVYPANLVGARERQRTPLGLYLKKLLKTKKAPYVDSGLSLIRAADAAKGLVLVAKRGEVGKRYPLVQHNLYFLAFLQGLEKMLRQPLKKIGLPFWLAKLRGAMEPTFLKSLQRGLMMEESTSKNLSLPKGDLWKALAEQISAYGKIM
ncbi:MAG: NAD-dependent epimerase/dehydratase family protein [Deltaproteobacteria bacterium]|nr:NAD-dependent epimerase/dehydratase family protein [Deltaproteobacteria bacterium]